MIQKVASKRARRTEDAKPRRLVLHVTLRHVQPTVWREISVPDSYSLIRLHRCIQLVFGWLDYHLFTFKIDGRMFEAPHAEAEGERADLVRLRDLHLENRSQFLYIYDMGDYWEHEIGVQTTTVESAPGGPDPCAYLIGGARAAPPEDVGGPPGYELALATLGGPLNRERAELVDWLGPGFDPELFDLRAGNHALVLATGWGVI